MLQLMQWKPINWHKIDTFVAFNFGCQSPSGKKFKCGVQMTPNPSLSSFVTQNSNGNVELYENYVFVVSIESFH